jgi:FlaA1/EpsC-like NDP-sugar epimerase
MHLVFESVKLKESINFLINGKLIMNSIVAVIYVFMFATSLASVLMVNMKIKKYISYDTIFFDEFNLIYRIVSIVFFAVLPLLFIYATENEYQKIEFLQSNAMAEEILAVIFCALFNLFCVLHAFNSKILVFKEYFLLINFIGKCKKFEFAQLKNSTEKYTNHFGEGYIFGNKEIKVKIPNHFNNIEDILKIIRENIR